MPIPFVCPHCEARTEVAETYAGQTGPCARCGATVTMPSPGGAVAPRKSSGMSVGAIVAAVFLAMFFVIGILLALLPPMCPARGAARRAQSMHNLMQIGTAMNSYESANRFLPAAYTTDKSGKPLLSWRVAILPYIEQQGLYQQFKQDEPWDSPHNKRLIEKIPADYRSPSSNAAPGMTNYLTVRGNNTAFPGAMGLRLAEIQSGDGVSHTIAVVEVSDEKAVPWTKPDDFEPDASDPFKGLVGLHAGGFVAAFCDRSVRFISSSISPEQLKALFSRNGNEPGLPDNF